MEPVLHIVNFGHALDPEIAVEVARTAGFGSALVHEHELVVDLAEPLEPQVVSAIEATGIAAPDWPLIPLAVGLPTHAPLAGVVLAELHGRIGHFPAIIRFAPDDETLVRRYRLAEVLNLEATRGRARKRR